MCRKRFFQPFLNRFAERARALKLAAAPDYSADMGSLMSQRQLDKVEQHVRDAVEKGATLVTGGRRRPESAHSFNSPRFLRMSILACKSMPRRRS